MVFVFSTTGFLATPLTGQARWGCRFSRRRPNHDTGSTGLHVTSSKPEGIDVSDLGGDSGSRLHAGGAKNPWFKKNHQKKEEKKKKHQQKEILKIATYNVRTHQKMNTSKNWRKNSKK